jgi:hypothetical protein
VGFEDEG